MRSKSARFALGCSGGVGVELCSPDVAFMFATVRNRSHEGRIAVGLVSSAKEIIFGCFQLPVALYRVSGTILLQRF